MKQLLTLKPWMLSFISMPGISYLLLRDVFGSAILAQLSFALLNFIVVCLFLTLSPIIRYKTRFKYYLLIVTFSFLVGLVPIYGGSDPTALIVSFSGWLTFLLGYSLNLQKEQYMDVLLLLAKISIGIFVIADFGNRVLVGNGLASTLFNNTHIFLTLYIFASYVTRSMLNKMVPVVLIYLSFLALSYWLDSDFAREQYKVLIYITLAFLLTIFGVYFRKLIPAASAPLFLIFFCILIGICLMQFSDLAKLLPVSREGSLLYRYKVFIAILQALFSDLPWSIFGYGLGASNWAGGDDLLNLGSHSGVSDLLLEFGVLSIFIVYISYPSRNIDRKLWLLIWVYWFAINFLNNSFVASAMFEYQMGLLIFGIILGFLGHKHEKTISFSEQKN